jgi:hypothetical protein
MLATPGRAGVQQVLVQMRLDQFRMITRASAGIVLDGQKEVGRFALNHSSRETAIGKRL